jgi:RNase adaptor protein for sRNA GlmZ degradation
MMVLNMLMLPGPHWFTIFRM